MIPNKTAMIPRHQRVSLQSLLALRSGGRKQGPAGYHLKTLVLQHLLDGHDFTSVHLCGLEHNPKTPIANHFIS